MSAKNVRDSHDHLLRELNEERVAALTRISRTLEGLIAELHERRQRIRALQGAERAWEVDQYRDVRARATTYRWYLDVQREALGLRPHRSVDEFYQVPSAIE